MVFKNPQLKKLLRQNGSIITLYNDNKLAEWLAQIPQTKKPRRATNEEAAALLIVLWYTGARPSEIVDLKKENIFPSIDYKGVVCVIKTLKRGEGVRKISIPRNEFTLKLINYVENSPPIGYLFHNFRSRFGEKNKQQWETTKLIYIQNDKKELIPETKRETKTKYYTMNNKKVYKFINELTGLPPLYFRHHRFSWMAKLKAPTKTIMTYKGAKDERSVYPYLQMGAGAEREYLEYFPTNEINNSKGQ